MDIFEVLVSVLGVNEIEFLFDFGESLDFVFDILSLVFFGILLRNVVRVGLKKTSFLLGVYFRGTVNEFKLMVELGFSTVSSESDKREMTGLLKVLNGVFPRLPKSSIFVLFCLEDLIIVFGLDSILIETGNFSLLVTRLFIFSLEYLFGE